MAGKEYGTTTTRRCEVCGREVPAGGERATVTRTLCLRCALTWQNARRPNWPPRGFVWNGDQLEFDASAASDQPYRGYRPTQREVQWWCYLTWLIATGQISVGPDEGAENDDG